MTIFVTGATGHLGGLVLEQLLELGHTPDQIVAGGRKPEHLAHLAERGFAVAMIDYDDSASLKSAFTGADSLLLVSSNAIGQRVQQHANAIDAAADAGVRRIVYTSAPRADTSELILAPEHKATEALITGSGLDYTILRNNWYTENYLPALEQARQTGTVLASAGDGRVASASRRDFAAAAASVLSQPGHHGQVYELSGDRAWDYHELATAITQVVGRAVTYTPVTPTQHLEILRNAGIDLNTAEFFVALDGDIRKGRLAETTGELNRLISRPTTPLTDGLRAALT
jgi:NAD(P)H dehydrogenase (quinone)